MSKFTKEELILLACWSVNRYEQVGSEQAKDEGTISLSHKIQDILINYCEHDGEIGKDYPAEKCMKSS